MVHVLKTVKPPKSNITREERIALDNLRRDGDLLILPADKGRATVLMKRDDYDANSSPPQ